MWKDGALLFFSIITVGLCIGWFVTAQIIVKRLATLEKVADETHEQLARIQQTLQTVKKRLGNNKFDGFVDEFVEIESDQWLDAEDHKDLNALKRP